MACDDTRSRGLPVDGSDRLPYGDPFGFVQPLPEGSDYYVENTETGESLWLSATEVEMLLSVEIGYIDWCIECDSGFKQGGWRVTIA